MDELENLEMFPCVEEFVEANAEWKGNEDLLIMPPTWEEIVEHYPDAESSALQESCQEYMHAMYTRGAFYMRARSANMSHRFAEMLAMQRGPALNTDATFFEGQPRLYEQFGSQRHLDRYLKIAASHGFKPNPTDVYVPGLARFRGDPEAFVPATGGRGHIKRICEKRGWSCDGAVKVQGRGPESDPLDKKNCKPLGEDIIQRNMLEATKADPTLKLRSRAELREMVIAKHGPR